MEEKYGKQAGVATENLSFKATATTPVQEEEESTSDSDSESEDDEGILASETLDAQINATLNAIRSKDPRVYDGKHRFYTDATEDIEGALKDVHRKDKPMYLSDYHRRNLLEASDNPDDDVKTLRTYPQQQDDLKSTLVKEMHDMRNDFEKSSQGSLHSENENEDGFFTRKKSIQEDELQKPSAEKLELDIAAADKDPETYLSNFMAARAWVPTVGSQFHPFESDDEEEERRADAYEEAYNLRFENPEGANEKLVSHARDAAAKYSVRQENQNSRKRAREAERAKKEAARQEREEEKARLRKLRIVEAEQKVKKIKQAAGFRRESIQEEEWAAFLDEAWDNERWENEMKKRFGDAYYAEQESDDGDAKTSDGRRKLKKPKWGEDIDIDDLIPGFEAEESNAKAQFTLTYDEADPGMPSDNKASPLPHNSLNDQNLIRGAPPARRKRQKDIEKANARKERRALEKVVDEKFRVEDTLSGLGGKSRGHFRYRETSPLTFGLSTHDILMASDSQLNQYAGLKKLAAYRDTTKKRKDKKHLGKKARLREWRKETFGDDQGPQKSFAEFIAEQATKESNQRSGTDLQMDIIERKRKEIPKDRKRT